MSTIEFKEQPKVYRCPKCRDEATEHGEVLKITLPGLEGRHCLRCYAKWVQANIPRLERISDIESP